MKKVIWMLIAIACVLNGCDKYEQTLKKIYGQYKLKSYTVNGIDSLNLYNDSLGLDFKFYYDEINSLNGLLISGLRKDGNENHLNCQWALINDNTILKIMAAYGAIGTGPFGYMKTPEWEIISLPGKEFSLKTLYEGKEFYIELN